MATKTKAPETVETKAPENEETTPNVETSEANEEITAPQLVKVFIPKDPTNKKEADKFVGVNGKNYLIKRGEYVEVPPEVAEVLMLSNLNAEVADSYIESNSI